MRYLLEQFPSISSLERQVLARLEITDTDQLLERAAMPARRESLARQSGISFEQLTRFAGLADLVRVKGIGPLLAETCVDSGAAGNIQQLIEHGKDLAVLRQRLAGHLEKTGARTRCVSLNQLDEMCAEARELRPRLLLQALKPDPQFRRDLFRQAWAERKQSLRLTLGMFAAVLVPIASMGLFAHFLAQMRISEAFSPYADLNQTYLSIEQTRLELLDRSTLTVTLILLGLLLVLFAVYDLISYLQATWLVVLLFPTASQQEFFNKMNSISIKKQVRMLWWMVALLAVVGCALVAIAMKLMLEDPTGSDNLLYGRFAQVIIPGGILMGVVASLPVLNFLLKELPDKKKYSQEHVQRYFVYYMFKVMMLPIMVVLLTQLVLPLALSLHSRIVTEGFVPEARARILEKRQELTSMQSEDADKLAWRDYALAIVDNSTLPAIETLGLVITPDDSSILDVMIPAALNMVVWIALTALLLLFVVPYLILGGWGRGLFYMFILGVSFALENKLTIVAPTWFRLADDSISQGPFIAFFVLINALFFDWLFEVVTNRRKICPACKTELEKNSMFCPECGYQQE